MDFDCSNANAKPHVALLSSPGLGHLIPVLELGKRFVTQHNFKVTIFVVPSASNVEAQILQAAMTTKLYDIVELPPFDISNMLEPGAAVVRVLRVIMREIRTSLRSAISNMQSPPNALIVDVFGTESILSIADEFNMLKYLFITTTARFLALTIYTPLLDKQVQGKYEEQKEPLRIPGCSSIRPEDVVDPMLDRGSLQYHEYVQMGIEMSSGQADGILLNMWEELSPKELKALRNDNLLGQIVKVPVYPIGPLLRPSDSGRTFAREVFEWLDMQPPKSVIYVSFGSGGTLSWKQMTEVAWGLELSQKKFVWVVRPPTVDSTDAAFFNTGSDNLSDPSTYLPKGFITRMQNLGKLIPMWAPQVDILGHPSIGGFLSHCGWNSTLESLTHGVPMIAWPLYAEQRLNATMLTDDIGVAVRPKELPTNKVVGRDEVKEIVRKVMEEEKGGVRDRAKELRHSAEKALFIGGSSHGALSQVAKHCEERFYSTIH